MVTLSRCLAALVVVVLALVSPARADIAVNTFGPGDTYDGSTFTAFGGLSSNGRLAVRFVPSAAANIDRVSAAMAYGATGTTTVTLSISVEVSGAPGPTSVWTSNTVAVGSVGIYLFTGSTVGLTAGQAYWITAYAPSSTIGTSRWMVSSPGVSGSIASGPTPWQTIVGQTLPAVRIENMPSTGACCSTLSGGCTVLTSATCALLGLRYDGSGVACGTVACHACRADFNGSGTLNAQDIFDFLNAWFAGCP